MASDSDSSGATSRAGAGAEIIVDYGCPQRERDSLDAIVSKAWEVFAAAGDRRRTWQKKGETVAAHEPDHGSQLKALELIAKLRGYLTQHELDMRAVMAELRKSNGKAVAS